VVEDGAMSHHVLVDEDGGQEEGATSASTASFGHGAPVRVSRRWVAAAARSVEKSFF
jgi:hypothetical protein